MNAKTEPPAGAARADGAAGAPEAAPSRRLAELRLLWNYARRYPVPLVIAFLALVTSAGSTLAIPQGFKLIVDRGFGAGSETNIAPYFLGLLAIVVVLGLATAVRFYFVSWIGERVVADLRKDVQRHLLGLDPGFFERNRPSEIASRLTTDTGVIEQVVSTSASIALRNMFMGVGGTIYLLTLSAKLTGLLLVVIPLVVVPIIIMGRQVRKLSRVSLDRLADVGSLVSELLRGIRIVQSFSAEAREAQRFDETVEWAFTIARRRIWVRALMTAVVITLVFGAITLVLWEGANDVISGNMSGGTITAFVLAAALVAGAFGALTEVYGDFMRAAGASSRMRGLLDERPVVVAPPKPTLLRAPAAGGLEFESVAFSYPTRPDLPALHNFTLSVAAGERVAIVGPSGAGKSTLFQLVERFYDPASGEIRLDGVNLRDADPQAIRARIAFVPQDATLFMGSVRSNIAYGRPDASDADVWAAAEAANAAEFIRALPDGLASEIGEDGSQLSGGQRQRIAIARALLKDAPILLLDEATSALDAESEASVQEALEHLMAGRTSLVIAHRLATIKNADRIVVMEQGHIVEIGTHADLIANEGLYARLADLQTVGPEAGTAAVAAVN